MNDITLFFIVMVVTFLPAEILKKTKMPYVITVMLGGILIGPYGLNLLENSSNFNFLASVGLIFLLFLTGLEYKPVNIKKVQKDALLFALFNGGLPFITGYIAGGLLGLNFISSIILGAVFAASCLGTISATLKEVNMAETRFGQGIITGLIIIDVLSLLIFGVFTQMPGTLDGYSLIWKNLIIIVFMFAVLKLLPIAEKNIFKVSTEYDTFERDTRLAIVTLAVVVFYSELVGLHAIVGGFVAGIALSEVIRDKRVIEKLEGIGYGFMIPLFFLAIGINANLSVLYNSAGSGLRAVLIINLGLIASKIIGGYISGRLSGFDNKDSLAMGFISLPQLSATVAMTVAGFQLGFLTSEIVTAVLIMSIITVFSGPYIARLLLEKDFAPARKKR